MRFSIRNAERSDSDDIFKINGDASPLVSPLTPEYFQLLLTRCALFSVIEIQDEVAGYLCALGRKAKYDGDEFQWFRENLTADFLYIDQVALGRNRQGIGLGRALYDNVETYARERGIELLVCEVNFDPYNDHSQGFHRHRGFAEIGRMKTRDVVVSLLAKTLIGKVRRNH